MKTAYVIMKQRQSPVYITSAYPHMVYLNRKAAQEAAKELQKKAMQNTYWVEKIKMADEEVNHG